MVYDSVIDQIFQDNLVSNRYILQWKSHHSLALIYIDTNHQANALYDKLLIDMKRQRNITEELKEENQMLWIEEMNNIDACINEIIYDEYIYN